MPIIKSHKSSCILKISEERFRNIKKTFYPKYIFPEIASFTGQIQGKSHSQWVEITI